MSEISGRSAEDEDFVSSLRSLTDDERKKVYDGVEEIRNALATPPIKDGHVRSFEQSRLIEIDKVWKITGKLPSKT